MPVAGSVFSYLSTAIHMSSHTIKSFRLYILFLGSVAILPAVATDIYLAAIPRIADQWGVPEGRVNLSLVLWFACFSISLLFCGSISDRYGRRPILLWGIGLFVFSTFLCAVSQNVYQLILFRVLQGISAAAPTSMSVAICRDRFDGEERHKAMAYMSVIIALAPMIAPMIGSMVLAFSTWRMIFILQATFGLIVFLISIFYYEETAQSLSRDSIFVFFRRYIHLFRNGNYMLSTFVMGISGGPVLAFVAFSPILFLTIFKLNNTQFSLLFGLNASMLMAGSFSSTVFSRWMSLSKQFYLGFIGCVVAGVFILFFGHLNAIAFILPMLIFSFCCNICRPASNNLILSQVHEDIGTASSFMIFYQCMFNSLCMAYSSHTWSDPIAAFSWLMLGVSLVVLALMPLLKIRLAIP
jgi:DHA1 family bicyclomycin/chloramphenicol resistance-like MFS transporter